MSRERERERARLLEKIRRDMHGFMRANC